MRISTSMRWLVVALSAAMLLAVAAACSAETVEVPGETVVVEKEVVKTVEVPGETVTVEVVKEVQVPGETVVVKEEVVKTVEVPGETVVVKEEVIKTVEVPGETITVEVVKTVEVPGETVVVEKEVVKTVEVPGQTVVVEKEVVKEVPTGYVTDPTTGEVVGAPQYGGTFTYQAPGVIQEMADPYLANFEGGRPTAGVIEVLLMGNWGISRDEFDFKGMFRPMTALTGSLAESWETSMDGRTITFHIRQGVNWQNKAPMNGRELTAQDIEYNFQRYLGLGSGFTEAAEHLGIAKLGIVSVEATDKYTVEFKLKEPAVSAVQVIGFEPGGSWILAPEVIKEYGDHSDWRNMVGTGPFMLTELVEGVSATWEKNPDYWGYDEKYPEYRLPYVDRVRMLKIVESATYLAALRTGKIDYMGMLFAMRLGLEEADSIRRTNPEIVLWPFALYSGQAFLTNASKAPLDDIRVRQALQMALDHETVNDTYFKGLGVWKPEGWLGATLKGYVTPFEEWPEMVKQYYTYDPAGAEELLEAAGYPRGADGVRLRFPMLFETGAGKDLGYVEISIEYWKDIGVEVTDIQQGDEALVDPKQDTGDWNLFTFAAGVEVSPAAMLQTFTNPRYGFNDPDYDALAEAAATAETLDEEMRLSKEADNYLIERHVLIWGPKVPTFVAVQPWVKGHNGETGIANLHENMSMMARLWIDQELKKAMGY